MFPHLTCLRFAIPLALAASLIGTDAARARDLSSAELRALRYYVEQGDAPAARAELQRLRALHPDWTPPEDLTRLNTAPATAAGPGDDANRIWRLIEIGNLEAARGRLEHLRTVYPDWTPPAEMTRLLATAEAQSAFDKAIARGDSNAVISVARNNPQILRCDRVNNAWQLAVMQAKVGQEDAALETYRGVLGSCTDTGVLVATLQKANAIATPDQLRQMASFAKARRPGAIRSLTIAEQNLLGNNGNSPSDTPKQAQAAPKPAQRQAARTPASPDAMPRQPARPGRLALTGDPRVAAARQAARAGAWTQCLARSTNPRSVDLLYERAWCAYNQDRSLEALAAFRTASTSGLGAEVQRDAKFGMVLSMLANQMTEDAARLAATTNLTREQRLDVESIILDQRGVRAFQRKEYRDAIAYLDALERLTGGIRRDLAIMRGYAYLNSGDRRTAQTIFETLHNQLATPETRAGLRAAML